MYRLGTINRPDQEAGLRRDAKSKKRVAERLREQARQNCVSGIDHGLNGNMSQANPILRQVEQLINKADQLDREANEHLSQIERNNMECQILLARVLENGCFRGELMQNMASLPNLVN